jgi:hypothetical protein
LAADDVIGHLATHLGQFVGLQETDGSRFFFDQFDERLATARARSAALLAELVNPVR